MGGKNDLVEPKAFFRSLLAFHEQGLYEVPYILTSLLLMLYNLSLRHEYSVWYFYNTVHPFYLGPDSSSL